MEFTSYDNTYDNYSVISEITDDNDSSNNTLYNSFILEDKLLQIKTNLNIELNKLNLETLKDKCKELGISGISKFKKPDLIQTLETEFFKLTNILKDKKINDLKNICKLYGIKKITNSKKDVLIYQILSYNSSNMLFKIDEVKAEEQKTADESSTLLGQLEKQKQEIETKMKEEIKKKEEEEKKKLEEEKKELKKKKQSIPKNVRIIVWNHYIGEDIIKHKCLCCKKVTISNTNFEVGHVLSENNGGTHEINNLRPICFACNHSMGCENMVDFVVKFGLYIG